MVKSLSISKSGTNGTRSRTQSNFFLYRPFSRLISILFIISAIINLILCYWYFGHRDVLHQGSAELYAVNRAFRTTNEQPQLKNYNYYKNNDNANPSISNLHNRQSLQTERDGITNLIVVACHAVLSDSGDHVLTADKEDSSWYLLDYQLNQDLPSAFFRHVQKGIEEVVEDPHALLVFSGGQTRMQAGPVSEASSYYHVAKSFNWFDLSEQSLNDIESRIALEEFAMDSYENLLFSICRFREVTGNYPSHIKVISFEFKKGRFIDYHRAALRYPIQQFQYIGVDPDSNSRFDLLKAAKGEKENSVIPYGRDPYGCQDPTLVEKRFQRNPFHRRHAYDISCPELKALLDYCSSKIYPYTLPWDR